MLEIKQVIEDQRIIFQINKSIDWQIKNYEQNDNHLFLKISFESISISFRPYRYKFNNFANKLVSFMYVHQASEQISELVGKYEWQNDKSIHISDIFGKIGWCTVCLYNSGVCNLNKYRRWKGDASGENVE